MLKTLLPLAALLLIPDTKSLTPPQLLLAPLLLSATLSNMNLKFCVSTIFLLDTMSTSLIMLTLWISALMLSVTRDRQSLSSLTILLALSLTLAFSMNNLLMFYIMFELSLIPIILMILLFGYQPERIQAATYMLIYTAAASLPLFIAILTLSHINKHQILLLFIWSAPSTLIWAAALSAAFLVKMPLYTIHLWLPKAHVEAPTAGSMILAALLLKLGSFGIFRILSILPLSLAPLTPPLLALGTWGAVLTTIIASRQTDFKALIAYSSVAHMSFMLAAILTMTPWGWTGAFIAMLTHGFCSSGLFALSGITYDTTNTRSLLISKGLINLFPKMATWWFVFCASNMAAPPFLNLLSEIMMFSSVMSKSSLFLISIILASFISALYNLHLYTSLNHGQPSTHLKPLPPLPSIHQSSMLFHLAPLLLLSLKPEIFLWL